MSADNCVAILVTKTHWGCPQPGTFINLFDKPKRVYRIAHVQAIENFDWYKNNQPHNLGAYMRDVWPDSPRYESIEEAQKEAQKLYDSLEFVEYGIIICDASFTSYYGE